MTGNGTALSYKEKEKVLQLIRERPGMSAAVLCKQSGMNYKRVLHYIRMLLDDGLIVKKGNMSSSRYYDIGYDQDEEKGTDGAGGTVTETSEPNLDIGLIMGSIDALRGIGLTNTDADTHIQSAIAELSGMLSSSLKACPFCGSKPSIVNSSGQYHIECSCGSLFAFSKSTRSATDTLRAYNMRAS